MSCAERSAVLVEMAPGTSLPLSPVEGRWAQPLCALDPMESLFLRMASLVSPLLFLFGPSTLLPSCCRGVERFALFGIGGEGRGRRRRGVHTPLRWGAAGFIFFLQGGWEFVRFWRGFFGSSCASSPNPNSYLVST